jgi:hypothetical protein
MSMELEIEFNQSAFKHGVSKADIRWAFKTFVFEEPMNGEVNKYLLIGFDRAGNPLEILFNQIDAETVNVFHAMRCRKAWRDAAHL